MGEFSQPQARLKHREVKKTQAYADRNEGKTFISRALLRLLKI